MALSLQGCYERHGSQGYCVIVNNVLFETRDPRYGSNKDADNIKEDFERIGFNVLKNDNLTKEETMTVMQNISAHDHSNNSCLFVFLLSHGEMEVVYSTNDEKIRIAEILSHFADGVCPTLAGKPKIFIVQACRDITDNSTPLSVLGKDCLVAYATMVGEGAFRDCKEGSWYIQEFLSVVRNQSSHDDLISMLGSVHGNLSSAHSVQCPELRSTLSKRLYIYQLQQQKSGTSSIVSPGLPSIPSTISIASTQSGSLHSGDKSAIVVTKNQLPAKFKPNFDPLESISPSTSENFAASHVVTLKESYIINSVPCGYCVVIDNTKVSEGAAITDEVTLTPNVWKLTDQFRNLFGFHVEKFVNLSAEAICLLLEAISRIDHSELCCFSLVILSRGRTRKIYGADGEVVSVNKVLSYFSDTNCASLVQKPKLFIIQTTLENRVREEVEEPYKTPSDSFFLFSTPKQDENSRVLSKIAESLEENCYISVAGLLEAHKENGVCDVVCKPTFKQCLKYPPLYPQENSDEDRRMAFEIRDHIVKATKSALTQHNKKLVKGTKRARVVRIIGSSVSLVGVTISVAGLILVPFTLGGSISLTIVGAGIGTAGAFTSIGATIAKRKKLKKRLKKVQKNIEDYVQLTGSNIPGIEEHLYGKENTVHVIENGVRTVATDSAGSVVAAVGVLHQAALDGVLALQIGGTVLTGISVGGAVLGGVSLVVSGSLSIAEIAHNVKHLKKGSKASRWLQDNVIRELEWESNPHSVTTAPVPTPYSLEEQSECVCISNVWESEV